MFCYINVLSTLLCLMLLYQNLTECGAKICPAGHMVIYKKSECVACPAGQYKSKSGTHINCDICSKCGKGSEILERCTSTSDTVCQCKPGFTAVDQKKNEICVCKKGSGENKQGICTKCDDGYFSDKNDSTCQKWRDCKSGIMTQGSSTFDAVCKNVMEEIAKVTPKVTTTHDTTLISTSKITSTSPPNKKADRFYSLWLVIVSVGILLLAGLLYKKCKVTHCVHNIKKIDSRKESVCRKPVEESGDKCQSLLV